VQRAKDFFGKLASGLAVDLAKLAFVPVAGLGLAWLAGVAGDSVSVRVWELVLLGAVLVLLCVGLVVQWRKARRLSQAHPHKELLARIDALKESLAGHKGGLNADSQAANAYNKILADAQAIPGVNGRVLSDLSTAQVDEGLSDQTYGSLTVALGQIKSVVE
jgi:hypothetical protein